MASTTQPSRMTTATGMSASTDLMARCATAVIRRLEPGGDIPILSDGKVWQPPRGASRPHTLPRAVGEYPTKPGRTPALLPAQLPLIVAQQRHHTATALDPVDFDLAA